MAPPSANFTPLKKLETGKLLLFNDFHEHLSNPLVCLISLVSSPSCYPVATASASIRRTMLPNNRRVRWLSASIMRQIFGAIAQYEKAMIVAKLRGARQRVKAKTGRCEGRKPYEATEAEVAVVARMREMRQGGMSYCAIADALTAEGVPSRLAQRWHTTQVQRILAESHAPHRPSHGAEDAAAAPLAPVGYGGRSQPPSPPVPL